MDLFSRTNLKAAPERAKQVKTWIAEIFNLDEQVTISLNQLTCRETDCPPIETVIVNTETCPCALRRYAKRYPLGRGLPQSL
jgi:phosphopantetheine adenylyltransferase